MNQFSNLFRRSGSRAAKRKARPLDRLELHVSHACNLACESCSHYSNHGHTGNLAPDLADRWMTAWSQRLAVEEFVLLGGEPTIHPRLSEFVPLARSHWPQARIRIVTNGFLLGRHPDLPLKMKEADNCELALSVHHDGPIYSERLRPVHDLLAGWQRDHGTVVHTWLSHGNWTQRYRGFGAAMLPFEDGQPRRSWEICPARRCKQLHDGKIWKCPPLAYIGLQRAKYELSGKWKPYLDYRPLDPFCSDRELDAFLSLEDEPECSMCSAERRSFDLPNPIRNASAAT